MSKIRITTEEFIEKAKKIHGDKYDYSLTEYKSSRLKIKIICPEHGEFIQKANNHLYGQGCPKCRIKTVYDKMSLNLEDFINRSNKIHHNKYDYSLVDYKSTAKK
jgi:hypothetical protein